MRAGEAGDADSFGDARSTLAAAAAAKPRRDAPRGPALPPPPPRPLEATANEETRFRFGRHFARCFTPLMCAP